jgi:hypothetical protein
MWHENPQTKAEQSRLLLLYPIPKTLPLSCTGIQAVDLGDYTHVLDQCIQKYAVYFYRDRNTFTIPFNTIP